MYRSNLGQALPLLIKKGIFFIYLFFGRPLGGGRVRMEIRGGRRAVVNTQQHCLAASWVETQDSWLALYRLPPP